MTAASLKLQPLFFDFVPNEYRSLDQPEPGVCAFSFVENTERNLWFIEHNRDFLFFKVSIFSSGEMILPDDIIIIDPNLLVLTFSEPTSGQANILYQTSNAIDCIPSIIVASNVVRGINVNTINADAINGGSGILNL